MTDSRTWDWDDQLADAAADQTRNDRFSAVLVFLTVAFLFLLGLANRGRISTQTWFYESRQAGIEATYPAGWLTDESGEYVVRIRNPRARPFKTQFQVQVVAAGGQTSIRNVLDGLTLQRSSDLAAYRVLSIDEFQISEIPLTRMTFGFVEADPNPFVQRLPVVVRGEDVLIRDGDRVIVVTYMADEASFEENLPDFERFLTSLRY